MEPDQFVIRARQLIANECEKAGPGYHLRASLYLNGSNDGQPELLALVKLLKSITPRPLHELLAEDEASRQENPNA